VFNVQFPCGGDARFWRVSSISIKLLNPIGTETPYFTGSGGTPDPCTRTYYNIKNIEIYGDMFFTLKLLNFFTPKFLHFLHQKLYFFYTHLLTPIFLLFYTKIFGLFTPKVLVFYTKF